MFVDRMLNIAMLAFPLACLLSAVTPAPAPCEVLVTTDAGGVITAWTCPSPSDCTAPGICNEGHYADPPPAAGSGMCECGDASETEADWDTNQPCTTIIGWNAGQNMRIHCTYSAACGTGDCPEGYVTLAANLTQVGGHCPCE
mgnify:CR=1 FL=1